MTRKDYQAIAEAIKSTLHDNVPAVDIAYTIAANLADVFAADNPRFDRSRFLAACGINE